MLFFSDKSVMINTLDKQKDGSFFESHPRNKKVPKQKGLMPLEDINFWLMNRFLTPKITGVKGLNNKTGKTIKGLGTVVIAVCYVAKQFFALDWWKMILVSCCIVGAFCIVFNTVINGLCKLKSTPEGKKKNPPGQD